MPRGLAKGATRIGARPLATWVRGPAARVDVGPQCGLALDVGSGWTRRRTETNLNLSRAVGRNRLTLIPRPETGIAV